MTTSSLLSYSRRAASAIILAAPVPILQHCSEGPLELGVRGDDVTKQQLGCSGYDEAIDGPIRC